jgi:hypothetical protein
MTAQVYPALRWTWDSWGSWGYGMSSWLIGCKAHCVSLDQPVSGSELFELQVAIQYFLR